MPPERLAITIVAMVRHGRSWLAALAGVGLALLVIPIASAANAIWPLSAVVIQVQAVWFISAFLLLAIPRTRAVGLGMLVGLLALSGVAFALAIKTGCFVIPC